MSAPDIAMARSITLGQRLTMQWQDEARLLDGLSTPNFQFHVVTRSGLAERRMIGGTARGVPVRWQLRLSAGEAR